MFEVEQENVFTLKVDMSTLAALEKGMSFYAERAILPDGDPAKDISRTLTSMLMKMGTQRHADQIAAPELPPSKEEEEPEEDLDREFEEATGGEDTPTEEASPEAPEGEEGEDVGDGEAEDSADAEPAPEEGGEEDIYGEDDDPLDEEIERMIQ